MPPSLVGLLNAAAITMVGLVLFAHGLLIGMLFAVAAAAGYLVAYVGAASFQAIAPNKKNVRIFEFRHSNLIMRL